MRLIQLFRSCFRTCLKQLFFAPSTTNYSHPFPTTFMINSAARINWCLASRWLSCHSVLHIQLISEINQTDRPFLPMNCCSAFDAFSFCITFVNVCLALEFPASQWAYFHSLFTVFFTYSLFIPTTTPPVLRICLSLFLSRRRSIPRLGFLPLPTLTLLSPLPKKMDSPSLIPRGAVCGSHTGADAGALA